MLYQGDQDCWVVVQSLSCVQFFAIPWSAACQVSLFFTVSWNLLKLMSTESVMPSKHLALCLPLLLLPSIFPSIRVFSNESALCIRWPKYWSFEVSASATSDCSIGISYSLFLKSAILSLALAHVWNILSFTFLLLVFSRKFQIIFLQRPFLYFHKWLTNCTLICNTL